MSTVDRLREASWEAYSLDVKLERPAGLLGRLDELVAEGDRGLRVVLAGDWLVGLLPVDSNPLGLAIDVGTTTVAVYVVDLESTEILAAGTSGNRQSRWGDDLMSRLTAAAEASSDLRRAAWESIEAALGAAARSLGFGMSELAGRLVDVTLAGNSAMHHLALGLPTRRLARAPYTPVVAEPIEYRGGDVAEWLSPWVPVRALPLVAAFVGSDVAAGLAASGLLLPAGTPDEQDPGAGSPHIAGEETALYIDIGTNAEMVLVAGGRAWACSAAAGPALEGARLSCGSPAGPGAITWAAVEGSRIIYRTWDGSAPTGLAGTGALSLLASLWAAELLDERGLLRVEACRQDWVADTGGGRAVVVEDGVVLTEADISELLLARAALVAGRRLLLHTADRRENEIDVVYVAGTLGNEIAADDLAGLGMIPQGPRVEAVGNAAGEGTSLALIDCLLWEKMGDVARAIAYVELSGDPLFEDWFVDALTLA